MKVIGLCGGSGSGKGKVCEIFSTLSVSSIDTDSVYHKLTSCESSCLRELVDEFGNGILNAKGGLDRSVLREIVFSSENSALKSRKREGSALCAVPSHFPSCGKEIKIRSFP